MATSEAKQLAWLQEMTPERREAFLQLPEEDQRIHAILSTGGDFKDIKQFIPKKSFGDMLKDVGGVALGAAIGGPAGFAAAAASKVGGVGDQLSGKAGEQAALEAAGLQATAAGKASGLLDPFQQLGQQGLDQAGFLTDPQAQFDFLQNNPLFQASLDNLNTNTSKLAAARGRVSAGDTFEQFGKNTLLAASPLIQQQKQSIGDLLNIGQNVAGNQGNLLTGQAAALAGGIVGGQNARAAGSQNIADIIARIAGGFGGSSGFGGGSSGGPSLGQQDSLSNLTNQNTSDISGLISGRIQ